MKIRHNFVLLGLFSLALLINLNLQAQQCDSQFKLVSPDNQAVEFLGAVNGVDIYGNYAIVSALGNNTNGNLAGAAHFYKKEGSQWSDMQTVAPTDISENDRFGRSVAIWGDYAIVGSPFDDINGPFSGSVYIYHRIGQSWIQEKKISPEDGLASDRFGWAVDIWEDYIIVGSLNDYTANQTLTGSAYVYKRDGAEWNLVSKLYPEDGGNFDEYGASLSIKDNLVLVGAHHHDGNGENSGAAYLYSNQDTAWVFQEKLTASDASPIAEFGRSVSVSAGLATIGAFQDVVNNNDTTGAVYVYRNNANVWEEEAKITTPETTFNMAFGIDNDHLGNKLAIGTTNANTTGVAQSGAVFMYEYNGSTWDYERKVVADDAQNLDFFGISIALDGDNMIVGAPGEDTNGGDAGAAYIHYTKCEPTCTTISSPIDGGVSVPLDASISWFAVEDASGYILSIGTTSGGTDVVSGQDLGNVLTYTPAVNLAMDTDYFVNITPYNDAGNSSGCIESEFTTSIIPMVLVVGPDTDVPCYEPIPNEDFIVNNNCDEVTAEVTTSTITGACLNEYTLERTYVVTDGCTTLTEVQIINVVDNDPPEILFVPEDVTIACGEELPTEMASGEDQCQLGPVFVSFEDSPTPECGQVIERTFSLIDDCGNVSTAVQIITIESGDGLPSCSLVQTPVGDNNPTDVTVTWTGAADAMGYFISIGLTSDNSLIVDNVDLGDVLEYDLTGLETGTQYFIEITPYNEIGSAPFCETAIFSTGALPSCVVLEYPTLADGPIIPLDVDLTWSNAPEANGYFLTIGTTPGGTDLLDNVDVMNVNSFLFPTLDPLATYYVTIIPYNEFGQPQDCAEFVFETDMIEGVEEIYSEDLISLYPNPNDGETVQVTFPVALKEDFTQLTIYNAMGKIVDVIDLRIKPAGNLALTFSKNLSSGVYHFVFLGKNGALNKSLLIK